MVKVWGKFKGFITKIGELFSQLVADTFYSFKYFVENNVYNFGVLISIATPYLTMYLGAHLYHQRGNFYIGGEILLPFVLWIFSNGFRRIGNRLNKGMSVPVYAKRFTKMFEDGEIQISNEDVEEVIIYLYELEEYLERTGKARWGK